MSTGAEAVATAIEQGGVQVCFGLPGVHNLALWDALRTSPVRLVGVRHEQTAAYAADGLARATGRVGVALTTTGPGAANTLGAVGEAWASRTPLLVLATDIATTLRRPGMHRGALHETTDQAAMFAPVTAARRVVEAGEDLGAAVRDALAQATAVRRPVYLGVPTDLLSGPARSGSAKDRELPPRRAEPPASVSGLAELLAGAQRPLVWAGSGAVGLADDVGELAERLCAPVLTTWGARGLLPPAHPCLVGMPPHVEPAGRLWDEADLVIAIGSDLDGLNTQNWAMPQPPRLIAVNTDPQDATKSYRADLILADLGPLLQAAPRGRDPEALAQRLREVRREVCAGLDPDALRFLDAIAYGVPVEAVIVADMCIPGYWIAGFHSFARPRALQYPMGWGTLGYAFPAGLGAALVGPGPVVSVSGDGGFLFACGELATMAQEKIPLTAVIVDDGGYGMLRFDQDRVGAQRFGVDLASPDFAALARAFGVRAETVHDLSDGFGEALARHVADPGPSVLVARAPSLEPPPTTSPRWYRAGRG